MLAGLTLEALEDRTLLTPYIVTTTADTGSGSLRDAITQINADTSHTYDSLSNPNVDEIDFDIPMTDPGYQAAGNYFRIAPMSDLPGITNAVDIDATTHPGYTPQPSDPAGGHPMILLDGANLFLNQLQQYDNLTSTFVY